MNGHQSRAGGRDNQGRSVNSKRDRTVIQTGSTTINTRTRQPPASKEHMGLWQKSVGAWRPGAGIEGHFLNAHSPVLSASTPIHPTAWEPNADFLEGSYKVTTIWSQLTFSAPSFLCICSVGPNSLIPPYIHLCVCCSPHLTCPPAFLFPGKISSHSPRPSSDIPFPYGNASKFPRQLSDSPPDPRALSSYFV